MILLDDRGHQPPLFPFFAPFDVQVVEETMDSADLAFCGNGQDGQGMVGIERKKIKDLIESLRSDRLAGFQLAGLLDYMVPMLIVEGIWRPGEDGVLEVLVGGGFKTMYGWKNRPMMYREISNLLLSVQLVWGVTVIRTVSPQETAASVVGMYHWFEKEWDEHRSHKAIYAPPPQQNGGGKARMRVVRPNLTTKMAAQIPGVDRRAWDVGKAFKSPKEMVNASVEEWMTALEIKKGRKLAEGIVKELKG